MASNFDIRRTGDAAIDDLQQRVKTELDRLADQHARAASGRSQLYGLLIHGLSARGYLAIPVLRDAQRRIIRNVRPGDTVAQVVDLVTAASLEASFEPVVTKADALRQITTTNLAGTLLHIIFLRGG